MLFSHNEISRMHRQIGYYYVRFGDPQSSRSSSDFFLHPCELHTEDTRRKMYDFSFFLKCNSFALHHEWKPLICWENWCYKMLPIHSDAVARWMHPLHKPLGAYEACALRVFLYIQTGYDRVHWDFLWPSYLTSWFSHTHEWRKNSLKTQRLPNVMGCMWQSEKFYSLCPVLHFALCAGVQRSPRSPHGVVSV